MVEFCSLASSSSGNCFYYSANGTSLLIDAGISGKRICEGLASMGKSIMALDAVLVTHEHVDHVKALKFLLDKFSIPVYMTEGTYSRLMNLRAHRARINIIRQGEELEIGGVIAKPIPKSHDCPLPISYSLTYKGKTVSFLTDIGYPCSNVVEAVRGSDVLFLESNHDTGMLKNGPYPHNLKNRILGKEGHLSNYDASLLALEHAKPGLSHVFLSHLSDTNNSPEMAFTTFSTIIRERKGFSPHVSVCPKNALSEHITLPDE